MFSITRVSETDYFEIFKDISLRYRIPLPIVEKICMSEFGCLRDTIKGATRNEADTFKNVRPLGLGLFYFSPGLLSRYKRLHDEGKIKSTK